MRRLLLLLPVAILAAALIGASGCGAAATDNAKDRTGAKKDVAQAIDDFASAARKGDEGKICNELIAPALRAKLAARAKATGRGADCSDQLHDSIRDADQFDMRVDSISISGRTATVRVTTKTPQDPDPVDTVTLVDQRGWRISALS
ncbi:MAG TPA: hypothetical protein VHB30_00030 [Solirubrobacteraceae bacterium]|jgi:hypothetical protein|nr:hypothetical protein [Solirubrobacteraceae bacterium]